MRIVAWGTYDLGKPRVRILMRGLRENGVDLIDCHFDVWKGVEDKSQVSGILSKIRLLIRWVFAYPNLIWRYLRLPKHDLVFVGYMGQLDVLVLWLFARLRGVPIVWDAFLSLYDTVVEDRRLVGRRHPVAMFLYLWEWLGCRAADLVLLDTKAHGTYFVERYHLAESKVIAVFVGTEPEIFLPKESDSSVRAPDEPITVLFYGQFIPLHGIDTIVRAARMTEGDNINWVLIGRGQEEANIREMLDERPLPKVRWISWVGYDELADWIGRADVCLGIFGDTDKAARVIPNKVFQILSAGAPLVTRDSVAIRELVSADSEKGIELVPPADPGALVTAIRRVAGEVRRQDRPLHRGLVDRIVPAAIGERIIALIGEFSAPLADRVGS